MTKERLYALIDSVKAGTYKMFSNEWEMIVERPGDEPYLVALYAFKYGFLKGQRAKRARQKKAQENNKAKGGITNG